MSKNWLEKEETEKIQGNYKLIPYDEAEKNITKYNKKEDGWRIVFTLGNDSKYGRWAYSDKLKMWRKYLTMNEFYGGSVVD